MDQTTPEKPTAVTVIGILIILLAAFSVVGAFAMMSLKYDPNFAEAMKASPVAFETLLAISAGGALIMLVAGVGVLIGANWGRWLYVVYSVAGIAFGAVTSPNLLQVLPSVLLLAVFAFFLFNGRANAYFNRSRG